MVFGKALSTKANHTPVQIAAILQEAQALYVSNAAPLKRDECRQILGKLMDVANMKTEEWSRAKALFFLGEAHRKLPFGIELKGIDSEGIEIAKSQHHEALKWYFQVLRNETYTNRPPSVSNEEWSNFKSVVHEKMARVFMEANSKKTLEQAILAEEDWLTSCSLHPFNCDKALGFYSSSEKHFNEACTLDPLNCNAVLGYANLLLLAGHVEHAVPVLDSYLEKCASAPAARSDFYGSVRLVHSFRLFLLNYICKAEFADVVEENCQEEAGCTGSAVSAGKVYEEHVCFTGKGVQMLTQKALLGYVSPDLLSTHAVAKFADHVIQAHDRNAFHVTVYLNRGGSEKFASTDEADCLRRRADKIMDICSLDTATVVQTIVDDGIDILIDLAAHSAMNRLDVFACQAAPIQVTWIGYPNTTGLSTMQYRVTDSHIDAPDSCQRFTEKLYRLPRSFLCFPAAAFILDPTTPPVAPPPFESKGCITFGSFSPLSKIQQQCFDVWLQVLTAVPTARICLKAGKSFLMSEEVREAWYSKFLAAGVSRERVELLPFADYVVGEINTHLASYSRIDIALDSLPYGGTTTIVEAALMGVPLITLKTPAHASLHSCNVGASFNKSFGLGDLVAHSPAQFVDIARQLASDPNRLRSLRLNLRATVAACPLGNVGLYQTDVENMFREMWLQYCNNCSEQGGLV